MRDHTLSQHFLRSPRLALKLIGHSNIKKRDVVLEIGAGSGVITVALAKRCRQVIAVEKDPAAAAKLRQNLARQGVSYADYRVEAFYARHVASGVPGAGGASVASGAAQAYGASGALATDALAGHNAPQVLVVEGDFLEMPLPAGPYKVFANPPFHLSSAIIHKLIEAAEPPTAFYLILQKQLALKLLNTDRHYTSQLGQQLIRQYQTRIRLPLRPTDFTPPPAVPTVLFEAKRIG